MQKIKTRKGLSADGLIKIIHSKFNKIRDRRKGNSKIISTDFFMSAFAMFSIKSPSLLDFDG